MTIQYYLWLCAVLRCKNRGICCIETGKTKGWFCCLAHRLRTCGEPAVMMRFSILHMLRAFATHQRRILSGTAEHPCPAQLGDRSAGSPPGPDRSTTETCEAVATAKSVCRTICLRGQLTTRSNATRINNEQHVLKFSMSRCALQGGGVGYVFCEPDALRRAWTVSEPVS